MNDNQLRMDIKDISTKYSTFERERERGELPRGDYAIVAKCFSMFPRTF